MYRTLLHAKIHRATITAADVHYEGSLTVDADLLAAAGLREFELVTVADVNNGARFDTYLMAGPAGSGVVQVNGAAARLVNVGDLVIIMAYATVEEPLPAEWTPTIVLVDQQNRVREIRRRRTA